MRKYLVLASVATLSACGGGSGGSGPQMAGNTALGGTAANGTPDTLATPAQAHTYIGVGGSQVLSYVTDGRVTSSGTPAITGAQSQQAFSYAANNGTIRNSAISVSYDPRDATFALTVSDPKSGAATTTRFQDPANRTDFGGSVEPQWGSPQVNDGNNIHYLEAGDGSPISPYGGSGSGFIIPGTNTTPVNANRGGSASSQSTTFFYQVPDTQNAAHTTTKYVTFAGYLRNSISFADVSDPASGQNFQQDTWHLERGAFAFGIPASTSAVPISGNGRYEGGMLATAIVNPTLDNPAGGNGPLPSYFQWISGTSTLDVDFAAKTVQSHFEGKFYAPQIDHYSNPTQSIVPAGATFTADGHGTINLVTTGGFSGQIDSAKITNGGTTLVDLKVSDGTLAGSSLDGAFYGPATTGSAKLTPDQVEVGGGFRAVGGTPDTRVDIVGSYAGARTGAAH